MSIKKYKKNCFSENLKKLRAYKEITLLTLSKILKLKYNTMRQYESKNTIPAIQTLLEISNYFKISINFLLLWNSNDYINNINFLDLANKIDKMTSNERYKIESTIETLLKINDNSLKSNFDTSQLELTNNIHNNIKILRENKKLSTRELSKILNCSSSVISQYERKINTPSPENLIKLSKFFNISIHYLITGQKLFFDFRDVAFKDTVLKADKQLSLEQHKFLIELMEAIIKHP